MYTIKDIGIFILSHNRATFLQKQLESFEKQTIDIHSTKIKVLCNDCTDNSKEVVESFTFAEYIPTYGSDGNYYKAIELANKEYVMFCHDDDIVHPQYFEKILKILNYLKEKPVLLGTGYTNFYNENEISAKYNKKIPEYYYTAKNYTSFARLVLSGICSFAYAAAIFKTEYYKKFDNKEFMVKYGRLADYFIMSEILKYGSAAILSSKNGYFHRLHKGADSQSKVTLLTKEQFNNVINDFGEITNNYEGFSTGRKWEMFEEYYNHTDYNIPYNDFLSNCSNKHLKGVSKVSTYYSIWRKRHDNIYYYFLYLILIKYRKKLKKSIIEQDVKILKKDVVTINFT